VGDIASSTVRASDFVARFGGEEFLVVLSNTDLDGAIVACDKLRAAIANLRIPGIPDRATASFCEAPIERCTPPSRRDATA
jgi:diguanylate cyclase (GGDEF)-like protein